MDAEVLAVGEDLAAELLPGTASFPSLTVMPDPGRIAAGRQPPQRLDGTLAGGLARIRRLPRLLWGSSPASSR